MGRRTQTTTRRTGARRLPRISDFFPVERNSSRGSSTPQLRVPLPEKVGSGSSDKTDRDRTTTVADQLPSAMRVCARYDAKDEGSPFVAFAHRALQGGLPRAHHRGLRPRRLLFSPVPQTASSLGSPLPAIPSPTSVFHPFFRLGIGSSPGAPARRASSINRTANSQLGTATRRLNFSTGFTTSASP